MRSGVGERGHGHGQVPVTTSSLVQGPKEELQLLPSIFHSIRVFINEFFASGGQNIGASASASVLPMNIQGQFTLALTGLILQPKGHSILGNEFPL